LELVAIVVEVGHRDERAPFERGIGRLRTGKEPVELEELLLGGPNLLDAGRHPDHEALRLRPDFPNLGLALARIVGNLRLAFAVSGSLHRAGVGGRAADPLSHLPPRQPGALRHPTDLRPFARRFMQKVAAVEMADDIAIPAIRPPTPN